MGLGAVLEEKLAHPDHAFSLLKYVSTFTVRSLGSRSQNERLLKRFSEYHCQKKYMSLVGHNSMVPIFIHKRYLQIILRFAKCGPL